MTWDKKIILVMLLFVAFMVTLGVLMILETSESVEDNYYEKDIRFQDNMQARQNAVNLKILPTITLEKLTNRLKIDFSGDKASADLVGKVYFQKPNNQKIDFSIPLGIDKNAIQIIPIQHLSKGVWYVWIEGNAGKYKFQTTITKLDF